MAERSYVRVEIGFDGGQILSWLVKPDGADELERKLNEGNAGTLAIESQEGTITLVLSRILYAKRYARESRVGFAE